MAAPSTPGSDGIRQRGILPLHPSISPLVSTTVGVVKMPATMARQQGLVRPSVLAGLSVLVVDDEGDVRDLLRVVLESCGMQVHEAAAPVKGWPSWKRRA